MSLEWSIIYEFSDTKKFSINYFSAKVQDWVMEWMMIQKKKLFCSWTAIIIYCKVYPCRQTSLCNAEYFHQAKCDTLSQPNLHVTSSLGNLSWAKLAFVFQLQIQLHVNTVGKDRQMPMKCWNLIVRYIYYSFTKQHVFSVGLWL